MKRALVFLALAALSSCVPVIPAVGARAVRGSCYGDGEKLNKHTATGEVFRSGDMTAAHRTLPFGTRVRVVNPTTRKAVTVRINDRGPAEWTGREIDLSCGAARVIGFREGPLLVQVQ